MAVCSHVHAGKKLHGTGDRRAQQGEAPASGASAQDERVSGGIHGEGERWEEPGAGEELNTVAMEEREREKHGRAGEGARDIGGEQGRAQHRRGETGVPGSSTASAMGELEGAPAMEMGGRAAERPPWEAGRVRREQRSWASSAGSERGTWHWRPEREARL